MTIRGPEYSVECVSVTWMTKYSCVRQRRLVSPKQYSATKMLIRGARYPSSAVHHHVTTSQQLTSSLLKPPAFTPLFAATRRKNTSSSVLFDTPHSLISFPSSVVSITRKMVEDYATQRQANRIMLPATELIMSAAGNRF